MNATAPVIRETRRIAGTVQGIGFRPHVHALASELQLGGHVRNTAGAVEIRVEGAAPAVEEFWRRLLNEPPALSRIESVSAPERNTPEPGDRTSVFVIAESATSDLPAVAIPADLAMCTDCAREVLDPADRRYGYPFTTCTRCGPRYTVVHGTPYDRSRTTLARFPLCPDCAREYSDPGNRRHHAESIACPACGPILTLTGADGDLHGPAALAHARAALARGQILAVRGLGGFQLACDASNPGALRELRRRKNRPAKPLALMAATLDTVRASCIMEPGAAEALAGPAAPIVILPLCDPPPGWLAAELVSPDTRTLGWMLPTSPLHLLLLVPLLGDPVPAFQALVMTSGNAGGEPICIANAEAGECLHGIADLRLEHDREINLRCDDSVAVPRDGRIQVWRRARGFAPVGLPLPSSLADCALALGADMKNAVGVGAGSAAWLSPHIGDLDTPEACDALEQAVDTFLGFLRREPQIVLCDLHPDFQSSRSAERRARAGGIRLHRIQHHHAHAAACLAEHGRTKGLALVLDGTGLGTDGTIWGAELLHLDGSGACRRLATFEPARLPGGDAATYHPARQLIARFAQYDIPASPADLLRLGISEVEAAAWRAQAQSGVNAPLTHSCGRLLDAFAALLGIAPGRLTYEGQAAIRLEAAALSVPASSDSLPFRHSELDGILRIDWAPAFAALVGSSHPAPVAARAVHTALVDAMLLMARHGADRTGETRLALSGGCFMNRILHEEGTARLTAAGLIPLTHRETPPGDACIAYGQLAAAAAAGIAR